MEGYRWMEGYGWDGRMDGRIKMDMDGGIWNDLFHISI